jgi:hypothetical protein
MVSSFITKLQDKSPPGQCIQCIVRYISARDFLGPRWGGTRIISVLGIKGMLVLLVTGLPAIFGVASDGAGALNQYLHSVLYIFLSPDTVDFVIQVT